VKMRSDHSAMSPALLERLRSRDPALLATVVSENARVLFRTAVGLGFPPAEAEDLVQDVFITFLEKLDSYEGRSQLRTWLFGILYRKAQEKRRGMAKDDKLDPIDEIFESRFDTAGNWARPPADLERQLLSTEVGEQIRTCLENLSLNQRQAFLLREVEEMETEEICKILGVSVTNFGVLMHRARANLRECLEAKGHRR
jgi:RNA polymerase sigma-70 factor (ECF subfamily)